MTDLSDPSPPASPSAFPPRDGGVFRYFRLTRSASLRSRLLALGLMPLVIAFPLIIAGLVIVGGERTNSLLLSNLRASLAGAHNYLDQQRLDTGLRVGQLVRSDRLIQLVQREAHAGELDDVLATAARGSGLHFLLVARADGTVIGSSTGVTRGLRLPESYVIRQARLGIANAAYERVDHVQLAAFSPAFPAQAYRSQGISETGESQQLPGPALMINAAAHFPLTVDAADAILVGGILLNQNASLVEHMREILFPVGALPGDAEGRTSILVGDTPVAISRQRERGQQSPGLAVAPEIAAMALVRGETWLGQLEQGGESCRMAYEPITDGDGQRIGMIGVGFPDSPYRKALWLELAWAAGLLALTLLGLSVLFLRAGRELTQRLDQIGATMTRIRQGERAARVGEPLREDELGQLSRHFDALLDTIESQEGIRRAALQTIADEASRRRALFEHERDGVVILKADGSVFEANPKSVAMLGYAPEEFATLRLSDWDSRFPAQALDGVLAAVDAEGAFFESTHRRKDGSTYPAEVSVSRARWADKTFWIVLLRDISERRAVEAELARYRQDLEQRVAERTREVNYRTGQLDAIFALSPDGFVSFDATYCVSFANQAFLRMTGFEAREILGLDEGTFSAQLAARCLAGAVFPGVAVLRAVAEAAGRELTAGPAAGPAAAPAAGMPGVRRQLIELLRPGNPVLDVGIRLSQAENVTQILYFRDVTHETEVDRIKSEFLTTAAHELRTPMASIYGFSELLLQAEFDEDSRREMLETIYRQSSLMSSIINELLDLARIEARRGKDFVLERAALPEIVGEAVAGYKPPAGRDSPQVDVPENMPLVSVDRKKMQQAILNILSNAYKYSPAGGEVRIAWCQDGRRVGVQIIDPGIGMTPEELARVWERFYRADTSGKIPGTGLGMSIVKEIVEIHGGTVQVVSTPGAGSSVSLWLPALEALNGAITAGVRLHGSKSISLK